MQDDWGEFFFMVGSSAAGLIGLLFVVATLTADYETRRAIRGMRLFMTPNVFHFIVVLTICALCCSPQVTPDLLAAAMAIAAVVGFVYLTRLFISLLKPHTVEHWSDPIYYGAIPAAGYVVLGFSAWSVWSGQVYGDTMVAVSMMGFLLLGIRNAWDLVSWMAPRTHRPDPSVVADDGSAKSSTPIPDGE
ncbi:MAG TPA: hypothetical protein VG942_06955 [Hyphomonadaceae bacterium]|nr:hypothetical protein [Hyphomonadaceae bacterium]